jgi:16S rRNA (uracil1498-N3)-methyltransferase
VSPVPHVLLAAPSATGAPPAVGATLPVDDASLHHLRRVLRLELGADVTVTDGCGSVGRAELTADGVRLVAPVESVAAERPALVLVQALAKGRRLDDAVRAACELGVDRIVPVVAERTQGRPGQQERAAVVARWRAIARSALEQSRSAWLTRVDEVRAVAELAELADLAEPAGPEGGVGLRLIAVPGAAPLPETLGAHAAAGVPGELGVAVAVGPEGGWTDAEVVRLTGAGWVAVGLGRTVLRTEHAGLVALSAAAALSGRWRDGG